MSSENLEQKVIINGAFLRANPTFSRSEVEVGLLERPWFLPTMDSNFWIPGMGTTTHGAMPSGCSIGDRSFGIFSKPFDSLLTALTEAEKTYTARFRGINTPPVIGVIDNEDAGALLVTELIYNAEALGIRDLSFKNADSRIYTPNEFLTIFTRALALMHNAGVINHDLHLGNIGHQFFSDKPAEVIFFDFEFADVLGDQLLMLKNNGNWHEVYQKSSMNRFERGAVSDLATFSAFLSTSDFPMSVRELLGQVGEVYHAYRTESYGILTGKDFNDSISSVCKARIRDINKIRNSFRQQTA